MSVRLDALLDRIADQPPTLDPPEAGAVEVTGVVHDTRQVAAGSLFCCVPGASVDGHDLAPDAVAAGAAALLVERPLALGVPELRVPAVRPALGPVADAFWDHPSRALAVVGVTGTSGKTTTTHLVHAVLEAHGWPTGIIGTLNGPRTTPEAPELQARLAAERDAGRRALAMEVSSHALALGRVRATRFACAVFTNLSHDHLDFHRDLDEYFEAKAALFTPEYAAQAVVNLDDERGRTLADRALVPTTGYSLRDASELDVGTTRASFTWRGARIDLPLGGRFNVSNALAAATAASLLGVSADVIARGLGAAPPVPGRFEPVDEGQPFAVVVDYSHKPDALARALEAAREAAPGGRVILVVGAGGDRDATKRPEMGEVAARLADRVLLTSDNPRGEDPLAIIEAIRSGMRTTETCTIEPDRATAIALAIEEARPGDVVLVAGKGHEAVQVVGDRTLPFDDREVSRAALRRRREVMAW
ncbi:MAG TPA: UDP-N-acetylmuramoyl-L-alanyl-D-glutamate--2,6-diaminopimelate ligase [Acidimicrobiales bacterium]|nr:UDP-N-acetylmuramoyl-L-alanyl-D-glutamate--2,6-diaminopimelate ligase [Acidimicrobiales bacterium]